jgi:hypothetical protein
MPCFVEKDEIFGVPLRPVELGGVIVHVFWLRVFACSEFEVE